jgi:hypothetical protein
VKKLGKVINPSLNTNPFNHNTNYLKLYTSVKDGIGNKDEFGQLINTQYLDDVFNFATNLPALTRKVLVDLGRKELLVMKEVQVFNYNGVNVAKGMSATQSTNYKGGSGNPASNAVDGNLVTISHTDDSISEYHILACIFPKYHVSMNSSTNFSALIL